MVLDTINLFIDEDCSKFDETRYSPDDNELQIVLRILEKPDVRRQISKRFEQLKSVGTDCSSKSVPDSNKHREQGNLLFRADKKANALAASRAYTNAILCAPNDHESLPLAHANRAAALVEFGYYFDAYCDCELALELGYPEYKQEKVLMRQAHCSVKLKDFDKLDGVLEKLRHMELNEACAKQKENFEEQLKIIAELPSGWQQNESHDYKVQNILVHPEKGRYMSAWKDYKQNDVLLTEKAFAFVPVENAHICSNCAKEQFIPYPCYLCSGVVYCSQRCKSIDEKFHKYECFAHRCDLFHSIGIAHLAMHALIRGLPDVISELIHCANSRELWKRIEFVSKSRRKGYPEILDLHNSLRQQEPILVHDFALCSIIAAQYLLEFTTFPDLLSEIKCTFLDWLKVISALILRHSTQMVANGQSSVSVHFTDDPYDFPALADIWAQPQHLKKGLLHGFREIVVTYAGIYPFLSFCNHSCEPSLELNFDGNRIIAKARTDLKKGDEIYNSYVTDYKNSSKSDRTETLRAFYHFECDCKHCSPEYNDREYLKLHRYRCRNPRCNEMFSLPTEDISWWSEIEENNDRVVKCPHCAAALEVDWFIQFVKLFEVEIWDESELIEALRLFKYAEDFVYDSELRHFMSYKLVTSFFKMLKEDEVEKRFFEEVGQLIKDWLDRVEEQNGFYSVLYVICSTFALDLMADGKFFDFDKKKIRCSLDMLSTELRAIFENYITDYIGEKFDSYEADADNKTHSVQ